MVDVRITIIASQNCIWGVGCGVELSEWEVLQVGKRIDGLS